MSSAFLEDNSNSTNNNTSHNISISSLINEIPLNTLNDYYELDSSLFKKKLEKLNLKFYWESESLSNQKEIPKPYNKLLLILFKEINLYTEEIERLNKILQDKDKNEKLIKEKLYEISQKEKERLLSKQMLKNYQKANKLLEKKLKEKTLNEDKLKVEIEKLKTKLKEPLNNSACSTQIQNTNINNIIKTKQNKLNFYDKNDWHIHTNSVDNKGNNNICNNRNITQEKDKRKNKKRNNKITIDNNKNFNCFNNFLNNDNLNNKNIFFSNQTVGNDSNYNKTDIHNNSVDNYSGINNKNNNLFEGNINNNNIKSNNDFINQIIIHYNDEIENLEQIEMFLENHKKEIDNSFTKPNFSILKNTIKNLPY